MKRISILYFILASIILIGVFFLVLILPQMKIFYRSILSTIIFIIGIYVALYEMKYFIISISRNRNLEPNIINNYYENESRNEISFFKLAKITRMICKIFAIVFVISGAVWVLLINTYISKYLALSIASTVQEVDRADAIVVMASGCKKGEIPSYAMYTRILHGYKLFKQNKAPILILNASAQNENGADDIKATHELARLIGIPQDSYIVFSERVITTRTEVRSISKFLKDRNYNKVIVVTDNLHMLRTMLMFKACGINAFAHPVQEVDLIETARDSRLELFNAIVHEWLGLILYWLRGDFASCNLS